MKLLTRFFSCAVAILALSACSDEPKQNSEPESEPVVIEENGEITYTSSLNLSQEEQAVVNSANNFAWNFFEEVSKGKNNNVVVSPLSASVAMTMMANAAFEGSQVQNEILSVLGYENTPLTDVNAASMKLADGINRLDEDVNLSLANSIWIDKKFPINPGFVSILKEQFSSESYPIIKSTFVDDVNRWSELKTNGMIKQLLSKNIEVPDMALINATYFKGLWSEYNKFEKSQTAKELFFGAAGKTSYAEFMNADKLCDSYKNDVMEMVTLPFGNGNYQFCMVRPNDGVSVSECISSLKGGKWNKLIATTPVKEYLKLKLPKFDIIYQQSLKETLSDLGMVTAMKKSDYFFAFPGGLQIGDVFQKSHIRIDEEGAEAASETYIPTWVWANDQDEPNDKPQPRLFNLNHPFIYLITEKESGTILFMGSINQF